jgi:hypothetical protein
MKKSYHLIAVFINVAIASNSFAAQDQALIQETRKNQLTHDAKESSAPSTQATSSAKKTTLPLDHGPRAVATPWENQQRKLSTSEQINSPPSKKTIKTRTIDRFPIIEKYSIPS